MKVKKTRAVFITGTGTGVGKSMVCGLLGRFLLEKEYRVTTQKWVQTGTDELDSDIDLHLKLMGKERKDVKEFLPHIMPYSFKFAASPHLAAQLEAVRIKTSKIKQSFKVLASNFEFVIVEGAGGALVPFNRRKLLIDIAASLNLEVVIVAQNELGAINHTLLTIEAVKKRGLKICGIIFNNVSSRGNKSILKDNIKIIKEISKEKILGELPFMKNEQRLYEAFIPIGNKFLMAR
ncbi:MAG: dethiobiotin synthase [Candidatus Omnitrophica bacterium]|nr:dethiobiotin synthase [Candidatus Omnitrophota bacterium]